MERMNWKINDTENSKNKIIYKDILETERSAKHTPQANIFDMDSLLSIP